MRTCTGDGSSPVGQWNETAPNCSGKGRTYNGLRTTPLPSLNMYSHLP